MKDFAAYPALADLPPLVRKQRRLEAKIVPLSELSEEEKAVRREIDALLIVAEVDGVTCLGYDVRHMERAGTSRLNQEKLVAQLGLAGLDAGLVQMILQACTETGDPSSWATVKPSKGSKVRS